MIKRIKIKNHLGLHARAAAKIVELGNRYRSTLFLRKDGQEVDGSSILSILSLSCPKGSEIEINIKGEDERIFMDAIEELFSQKFGEPK